MNSSRSYKKSYNKETHVDGKVSLSDIKCPLTPSIKDGVFVIRWGKSGQYYAYLHNIDAASILKLLNDCRNVVQSNKRHLPPPDHYTNEKYKPAN
jgi:hypothetical protein